MTIHDLDTPALTIDLDILKKNIRETQAACDKCDIPLRVHTKTHKIPEIARMQLAAGAIGIVCQKVGEAEVMVEGGIPDILIPYNIVGPIKVKRLAEMCKRATMTVAIDSEITARGLSDGAIENHVAINILIECDTGGNRCGVQSPKAVLELAQKVTTMPGLQFQGIMTYPSHERAKAFIDQTRDLLQNAGIALNTISGGGTGTAEVSKAIGCTETRIGSYVFEGLRRINREHNPAQPHHLCRTHDSHHRQHTHTRPRHHRWRTKNIHQLCPHPLRIHRRTPQCQNLRHVRRTRSRRYLRMQPHLHRRRPPLCHPPASGHDHQPPRRSLCRAKWQCRTQMESCRTWKSAINWHLGNNHVQPTT